MGRKGNPPMFSSRNPLGVRLEPITVPAPCKRENFYFTVGVKHDFVNLGGPFQEGHVVWNQTTWDWNSQPTFFQWLRFRQTVCFQPWFLHPQIGFILLLTLQRLWLDYMIWWWFLHTDFIISCHNGFSNSVHVLVTQSCPTLCNPMDCNPSGSSVHGVLQTRILEKVAIPFSRGSSQQGIKLGSPALQPDSLPSYQGSP